MSIEGHETAGLCEDTEGTQEGEKEQDVGNAHIKTIKTSIHWTSSKRNSLIVQRGCKAA